MAVTPPTLIDQLDATPPWVCRLINVEPKTKGRGLPVKPTPLPKLVKRSRLSYRTFQRITWLSSYKGISIDVVSKFREGCGMNPDPKVAEEQVMSFMSVHGPYCFKLAPRGLPRKKLKALDKKYQKWCEARELV